MTSLGIIGMGKMGQSIYALMDHHQDLVCHPFSRLGPNNENTLKTCDVVIEFTTPEAAPGVIMYCLERNIPVVSGTTGWHEYHLDSIITYCRQYQRKFLYATNFSVGMNIMFALNRKLADVMATLPQFKPSLKEIHHIHKKDSPSGTAYTLMEDLFMRLPHYSGFVLNPNDQFIPDDKLPVTAIREGEVKGFHQVTWNSGLESISLAHEAFDRRIFAEGAIMAARWLHTQPQGLYTMRDLLKL